MKKNYLLGLIVLGLISLSVYSTYAMFTASVETNDIVSLSASTLPTESEIVEYERLTIKSKEKKVIEYTVNNNTDNSLYYGVWYEMINPNSINDDIVIGKSEDTQNDTLGLLTPGINAKVLFVIENKTDSNIVVNVGVGYSETSSLNLPTNRNLITEVYIPYPLGTEYIENLYNNSNKTVVVNNEDNYNLAVDVGLMEDVDSNIRYYGANPNNYISFNNELWRIIGVFKNIEDESGNKETKLKIIKANSTYRSAFNNTANNEWRTSSLNTYLNGTFYNSINDFYKNIISESYWNTGGISAVNASPKAIYEEERGTTVYDSSKYTKTLSSIVVPYPSDFGYAVDFQKCNKLMNAYNTTSCKNNNWLYLSTAQRMLSPRATNTGGGTSINTSGILAFLTTTSSTTIRPTLYLDAGVMFESGDGSQSNPFKIVGSPPPPTAVEKITSIYLGSKKTTATNNGITYNYATSVKLMNDKLGGTITSLDGGNIRYYGANPNNYVLFNNELWRIIGVFKDIDDGNGNKETRLKIIRNESIIKSLWDTSPRAINSGDGINEWSQADSMNLLNLGPYWNRTNGVCYTSSKNGTENCDFSNNGLTEESKLFINNAIWYLGATEEYENMYANDFYVIERGTEVQSNPSDGVSRTTSWIGKVALIYPSDYLYSTDLSKCTGVGARDCYDTSWIYKSDDHQWTITPHIFQQNSTFFVNGYSGTIYTSGLLIGKFSIYPSVYLKPNVIITGGDGSSSNPYTLSL